MFLFSSLPVLLCVVTVSFSNTKAVEDAQKTCPVVACAIPVTNGTPGRDGRDGPKGEKGEPGRGQATLLKPLPQQDSVLSKGSSIETGGGSPFIMVRACERAFSLKMLLWLSRIPHCHPGIGDTWLSLEKGCLDCSGSCLRTGHPQDAGGSFFLGSPQVEWQFLGVNQLLSFWRKRMSDSYFFIFPSSSNRARAQRLAGPSRENGASRKHRESWASRTQGLQRRSWR